MELVHNIPFHSHDYGEYCMYKFQVPVRETAGTQREGKTDAWC